MPVCQRICKCIFQLTVSCAAPWAPINVFIYKPDFTVLMFTDALPLVFRTYIYIYLSYAYIELFK